MILDHIGIAVTNLEESIAEYERTHGLVVTLRERLESQQVELVFLQLENTKIELLTPLSPESTLAKFIQKRGPGLHHLCYQVKNIEAELKRFESLGHRLIDKVARPGANHTKIAFIHPQTLGGVLTELCEYTK
jgi:methylmalonyl-CoA epimerase